MLFHPDKTYLLRIFALIQPLFPLRNCSRTFCSTCTPYQLSWGTGISPRTIPQTTLSVERWDNEGEIWLKKMK